MFDVLLSSSVGDPDEPLNPDPQTETTETLIATISSVASAIVVTIVGDMNALDTPDRDAFVRVRANFNYTDGVEAALGPFASIDCVIISFVFNG